MNYTFQGTPKYGVASYFSNRYGMYLPPPTNGVSPVIWWNPRGTIEYMTGDFAIHFKTKFISSRSSYNMAFGNSEIMFSLSDSEKSSLPTICTAYSPWTRYMTISGYNFMDGQWKEILINRKDGLMRLFLNGNIIASVSNAKPIPASFWLGNIYIYTTHYLDAVYDDIVIVKDSAIYTENYTPSTGYFLDPFKAYKNKDDYLYGYK